MKLRGNLQNMRKVQNDCVQRFIDLRSKNEVGKSIQHVEYIETAPKFAAGSNGATAWLTSDIAILTVENGFFQTKQDMMKHSFRLNLKQRLKMKKRKRKNAIRKNIKNRKKNSSKKTKQNRGNRGRKRGQFRKNSMKWQQKG